MTENLAIATFVPFKHSSSELLEHDKVFEAAKQLYDPEAHGPDTPGWDLPPSVLERWRAGSWGVNPPAETLPSVRRRQLG